MHAIKLVVWCPFCDWAGYAPVSEKGPSMRNYQCPKCGHDLEHWQGKTPLGGIAKLKEVRDNIRREGKVKPKSSNKLSGLRNYFQNRQNKAKSGLCSLTRKNAFIEAHTSVFSRGGGLYDLGKIKAHL